MARPRAAARPAGDPTRERIVRAALAAFAEAGFEGASTRAIAAAADANQGLVAYYFGDKARLWREAVAHGLAALAADLEAAGSPAPLPGAAAVDALLTSLAEHADVVRVLVRECLSDGARLRRLVRAAPADLLARLRGLARERFGADVGEAPADAELALLLGAAAFAVAGAPGVRALTGVESSAPEARRAQAALLASALAGTRGGDWSLGAGHRRRWTRASESW